MNFPHVLGIIVYGLIGLFLSIIGYLSFKAIIPFRVDETSTEKENIAVGTVVAGIIIGVSIIVAAASYEPGHIVVNSSSGGCGSPGSSCQSNHEKNTPALPHAAHVDPKGSAKKSTP